MSAAKAALGVVGTALSKLLPDFDAVRTEAGIDLKASAEASLRSAEDHKKYAAKAMDDAVEFVAVGTPLLLAWGIGIFPLLWGFTNAAGAAVEKLLQAKDEADAQAYAAQAGREALSA